MIPAQRALHSARGDGSFGGVVDVGGGARGALWRRGCAVDGAEEDGAVGGVGLRAGEEGGEARGGDVGERAGYLEYPVRFIAAGVVGCACAYVVVEF